MSYYKNETKANEQRLKQIVEKVYNENYNHYNNLIPNDMDVSIHYINTIPYSYIKDARKYFGLPYDYIGTVTDKGKVKKSDPDGGAICVKVNCDDKDIYIPICWYEVKTSYSCTTGTGARGQATGLIAEQESRCRAWAQCINYKVKPLIAIMQGTDFDENRGIYNIDRIKMDLHTRGNVDPYVEGNDGVAWLYYNEKLTDEELENIVYNTMNTKVETMIEFLHNEFK